MRSITRTCGTLVALALVARPAIPLASASQGTPMTAAASTLDSLNLEIDRAYIRNDSAAITSLLQRTERATVARPEDPAVWTHYGYAIYRSAAIISFRARDEEKALLLQQGSDAMDRANKLEPTAERLALKSAILGLRIDGFISGIRFGRSADNAMKDALEKESSSARIWLLKAKAAYYAPRAFGGGADASLSELRRVIALAQSEPESEARAITMAEAMAYVALIDADRHDFVSALASADSALQLQPGYEWVKQRIRPKIVRAARQAATSKHG